MSSNATIGALRVVLGLDSAQFTDGLKGAQRQLRQAGDRLQGIGTTMAGIGAGLTATITAPVVAAGVGFAKAAIAAEEMQSAFNVSFGAMASDVRRWAETTGNAMGRSTFELQEMALGFNGLFKAGGPVTAQTAAMSRQFTTLAQDLSSFHNVAQQDVFAALRSGLSGEAEPLRRFNVYLTEAAVKAEAMRLGLVGAGGALSEQAKIQARASLIMKGTVEAQGDVIRTSAGTQNQLRALESQWAELSVTLGQRILPLLTPVVAALNRVALAFSVLSPQVQSFVLAAAGIAAVVGPLMVAAGAITAAIGALLPVLAVVGAPLLAATAAVAGLVAVFLLFRKQIMPVVEAFAASLQENLGPKIAPLWEALKGAVLAVGEVFSAIFGGESGQAPLALMVFGEVVARVFGVVVDLITGAVNVVTNVFRALAALLRGDFSAMWGYLGQAVMSAVRGILNAFETLFPGVTGWVQRTFEGVKHWLLDRFADVVRGVGEKVQQVEGFFRNLWDAVVGHSWIPDMVEAIGDWMGPRLQALMVDPAQTATQQTSDAFGNLSETASSHMDALFKSIASKDWKGALGGILGMFGDKGGALGSIGKIGSAILSSLPAFANGGSFKVGGTGGIDSQVRMIRATPSETVSVTKPGQGPWGQPAPISVQVSPSPYFDVRVERVATPLAGRAFQGARQAVPADMARRQRFQLGAR